MRGATPAWGVDLVRGALVAIVLPPFPVMIADWAVFAHLVSLLESLSHEPRNAGETDTEVRLRSVMVERLSLSQSQVHLGGRETGSECLPRWQRGVPSTPHSTRHSIGFSLQASICEGNEAKSGRGIWSYQLGPLKGRNGL